MEKKKIEYVYIFALCFLALFLLFLLLSVLLLITISIQEPKCKVNMNNDELVYDYVIRYYPEYTNYSIRYLRAEDIDCELGVAGAIINYRDNNNGNLYLLDTPKYDTPKYICFDNELTIMKIKKQKQKEVCGE